MPAPTPDELAAIEALLVEQIEHGNVAPLTVLTEAQHQQMLEYHYHDVMGAGLLLERLRARAREARWDRREVNGITFRYYADGVRQRRQAEEQALRATNVIRMDAARAGGERRRRRPAPPPPEQLDQADGMTAEQMLATESPRLIAIGHLLSRRRGHIWYDEFYKRRFTDWSGTMSDAVVPVTITTDSFENNVLTWLHMIEPALGKSGDRPLLSAIAYAAERDRRNAPKDWLNSLVWDEQPRLASLFTGAFGAPDTQFNIDAARCWMVSMVARVMEPGCKVDTMPVFYGGQGAFKSQALEIIGGEWYRAASSGIDSKDFLQELHGVMLLEIPELHSLISTRHGSARIKSVLSTRIDHFRLPYGRNVEEHRRTAVLAGSTNDRGWHGDDTGGRRFWPVHVGERIDLQWLRENRDQLFAEAVHLWRNHGMWWDVPEDEQAALIEAERAVDPWEDVIADWMARNDAQLYDGVRSVERRGWDGTLTEAADWGTLVTVERVGIQCLRLTMEQVGRTPNVRKITTALRLLGWEKRRVNIGGRVVRAWLRNDADESPSSTVENVTPLEEASARSPSIMDDDIPF